MKELYELISEEEYGKSLSKGMTEQLGYQNRGIAKSQLTLTFIEKDGGLIVEKVECPIPSCGIPLKDHDKKFKFCYDGCHGYDADQVTSPSLAKILKLIHSWLSSGNINHVLK